MNQKQRRARILLVDDDRRIVAAMLEQLSAKGFDCVCCSNVSEAMMQFAVGHIDLVITDLNMRGIDGFSMVEMVRSQSDIPIIVATGYSKDLGAWTGRHEDVVVIQKPLDMPGLLDQIEAILSRQKCRA